MLKKIFGFLINISGAVKSILMNFFKNIEAVMILALSSIGLSSIIMQYGLPFSIPAFINPVLFVPALSAAMILLLTRVMTLRQKQLS